MLVILDRDGVINFDSDAFIKQPDEWIPIPGSLEAIAKLKTAGHQVAVATNQSGLGRGLFSEQTLSDIHQKFNSLLAEFDSEIDLLVYCPHHPDDGCDCRKPKPGLMKQISKNLDTPTEGAWVIGDSLRDLEAGVAVGAKPMLVKTGKGERTLGAGGLPLETLVFENLSQAVEHILS